MVGLAGIIFFVIPESPWWLVSKGRLDSAGKVLKTFYGDLSDAEVSERLVRRTPNRVRRRFLTYFT